MALPEGDQEQYYKNATDQQRVLMQKRNGYRTR